MIKIHHRCSSPLIHSDAGIRNTGSIEGWMQGKMMDVVAGIQSTAVVARSPGCLAELGNIYILLGSSKARYAVNFGPNHRRSNSKLFSSRSILTSITSGDRNRKYFWKRIMCCRLIENNCINSSNKHWWISGREGADMASKQ